MAYPTRPTRPPWPTATAATSGLRAAEPAATNARAVSLNRRLLRLPQVQGAPQAGRWRLHHAATATIVATQGVEVSGDDGHLALQAHTAALPRELAQRYKWVGARLPLALAAADVPRMAALLRSAVLLVQEDGQGRMPIANGSPDGHPLTCGD